MAINKAELTCPNKWQVLAECTFEISSMQVIQLKPGDIIRKSGLLYAQVQDDEVIAKFWCSKGYIKFLIEEKVLEPTRSGNWL